ncbi:adenylyltransferase and sulfurtransferase MOCS3-like [Strongylocentrotus purpuratus]|uniref:Adenylyltransferase and sulfurtransferase MOCS3 homolog n=1 Tax=Strongylocentrotus purpuratus TaxID=7668 RepID=A0A7M7HC91_STRPU|nr:adenylyltransferase and sulfurtransferase MOCS3-like [Strongylocentrotus purpuratus]|eukprot:XP_011661929.1 PREDICTED: adenylyltransferase and sulfurtransferase MOCS3-like isoform X2 [Strongylocentrotus purpuratus]
MDVDDLKELHLLREENARLRLQLEKHELELMKAEDENHSSNDTSAEARPSITHLDNASIKRYSRQLILPELGVKGQLQIANSSALIVGAGGLGCPAAIYLAAAGIGRLGVVDYDEVELSNLHRQILHTEQRVGWSKSDSIKSSIKSLNSSVQCIAYHLQLDRNNAMDIIRQYDMVLDCTDNVATRYLLNDACVLAGKPLVSGSALRFEGQLTVYNQGGGPCYRCLYPRPPPAETVTNCSEGGVLGVVPGIIGCIQALEALKMAAGIGTSYSQKLLLFDGLDGTYRSIKLRPKKPTCDVCGDNPSVTQLIDYEEFCGASATDKCITLHLLEAKDRLSPQTLASELLSQDSSSRLLLDCRPEIEFEICRLPDSINVPIDDIENEKGIPRLKEVVTKQLANQHDNPFPIYVVCRRGNDSQKAVLKLRKELDSLPVAIKDVCGGLTAWTNQVDPDFPEY